ncbi:MAG: tyrosine-type recombinase/integrase [Ramlibacter sp.]|nr:tyrosine-type recombinase/integrase [Ramlibacter sp.]
MRILSKILGQVLPRYRTLAAWAAEYDKLLEAMPIKPKTLGAHRYEVRRLLELLGADTRIGSVRPSHIARIIKTVHATSPMTARRTLIEARAFFDAAMIEGWIDANPAAHIRQLPAPVARKRLSFEEWQAAYECTLTLRARWPQRMMLLALVTGQRRADLQKMRFADIWDGRLHVVQQKTGAMIALPLSLRLDLIDLSICDVVSDCLHYAQPGPTLLRKPDGMPLSVASLSTNFRDAYRDAHGEWLGDGDPPSLHETRSLAERLYRKQGIDTMTLLGHKRQAMTDKYNDDRGLSSGQWKVLELPPVAESSHGEQNITHR